MNAPDATAPEPAKSDSRATSSPETRDLNGARGLLFFLVVAVFLAIVDLASKDIVFAKLQPGEVVEVVPGVFNLILAKNFGAAFSIGWGQTKLFLAVSMIAFVVLSWFSWTAKRAGMGFQTTLGLIASGVIGNVHDRLVFGYVRDFLDVYAGRPGTALATWFYERFGTNHWPTFNVADACICVGTGFLLVKFWGDEKAAAREAKAQAATQQTAPAPTDASKVVAVESPT